MKSIAVDEFRALLADKSKKGTYQIVDVRELDEYKAKNIPLATLVPLSQLNKGERFEDFQGMKGKMIIVHCRSGMRSQKAIALLETKYKDMDMYNLTGGIEAFLASTTKL
eukprot:c6523_g1_i1.p1 GENE.c6523_g1_i1~~c6523_g1_i1.p1  ORF type:complete len:110 (+),score=0.13 c6523_g1_i1:64-393(+)